MTACDMFICSIFFFHGPYFQQEVNGSASAKCLNIFLCINILRLEIVSRHVAPWGRLEVGGWKGGLNLGLIL